MTPVISLQSESRQLFHTGSSKPVEEYADEIRNSRERFLKQFGEDFGHTYDALEIFARKVNFRDKAVLEIGGAIPPEVGRQSLLTRQWIAVNKYDWIEGYVMPAGCRSLGDVTNAFLNSVDYQVLDGAAEDIPECFFSRFDIVCSINAFEHIHNIWKTVEKAYASLKDGGLLVASFGPIWSSHFGHHVYISHELNFNTFQNLPDYIHLIETKGQCYRLIKTLYNESIADQFIVRAFFDSVINRLFLEDYVEAFQASRFEYWHFTPWERKIDPEVLQQLRAKCGDRIYAEGLSLIAQKQASIGQPGK